MKDKIRLNRNETNIHNILAFVIRKFDKTTRIQLVGLISKEKL